MKKRGAVRAVMAMLMCSVSVLALPAYCYSKDAPSLVAVTVVARDGDVALLAKTIFLEARSEGARGMTAVAHVVLNRLRHDPDTFGRSLRSVIHQPAQFSSWGPGRAHAVNRRALSEHDPTYQLAQRIAWQAMSGLSQDPTGGALYYHERSVKPYWTKRMVVSARVGRHVFYKPRRD